LLHWDGLADVADGLWGAHTPLERIAIMGDSRIGAFGTSVIFFVGLLQVSAVLVLISEKMLVGVLLAPVIGRFAAVAGSWFGSPAKPTGLGAAVTGPPRVPSAAFALAVLAGVVAMSLSTSRAVAMVALAALLLSLSIPHLLASRFGGVTGDVLGASVMLTETAALVLFALVS
jgi:adenosylcobinamide-GDP ribazoletransferase